jgi:HNH endonuclease
MPIQTIDKQRADAAQTAPPRHRTTEVRCPSTLHPSWSALAASRSNRCPGLPPTPTTVTSVQMPRKHFTCTVDECGRPHHSHGYCRPHLYRWRRYGDPLIEQRPLSRHRWREGCSVEGCAEAHSAKGYCQAHWYQLKTYGDPLERDRLRSAMERFAEKVIEDENGCWIWHGGLGRGGYGMFRPQRPGLSPTEVPQRAMRGTATPQPDSVLAHRWAYELVAPIPAEYDVDHLCGVPRCVNPRHLEPVTPWENRRRAIARRYGKEG